MILVKYFNDIGAALSFMKGFLATFHYSTLTSKATEFAAISSN